MRDGDVTGQKLLRMGVLVGLGTVAVVAMNVMGGKEEGSPEPSQRGELVVQDMEGERWLVHSAAAFRLRHPGPAFQRAPEIEREMSAYSPGQVYAFKDGPETGGATAGLIIFVEKPLLDDDQLAMQSHLAMLKAAVAKTRDENPGIVHRIDFEELTEKPPYIARTWGYNSGARSASLARVAHPAGAKERYVVALLALGRYPAELGPVLESLHVLPESPRGRSLEQQRQQLPQFRKHRTPPRAEPAPPPPPAPPPGIELVRYRGPAGTLSAYLHAPKDRAQRHPAVLWCHGGFGGIDQSQWAFSSNAKGEVGPLFAEKGFVVLSPAWRGESGSDGQPELFWGEVDDALASIDYLAKLDFVDPSRIYVAGHSSGATLALLVGQREARIRAVFSFGGAFDVGEYDGASFPFDPAHGLAAWLRSPLAGIAETKVPTFHFEGAASSSEVERIAQRAARRAKVPVSTFVLDGLDHWTAVPPMARLVIEKAAADRAGAPLAITRQDVDAALAKQ